MHDRPMDADRSARGELPVRAEVERAAEHARGARDEPAHVLGEADAAHLEQVEVVEAVVGRDAVTPVAAPRIRGLAAERV